MASIGQIAQFISQQVALNEWDGNIHNMQAIQAYGDRANALNPKSGSDRFDVNDVMHRVPMSHFHRFLSDTALRGHYLDHNNEEHVKLAGIEARRGWAMAADQRDDEWKARTNDFATEDGGTFKFSKADNIQLAKNNPNPVHLYNHLRANGVSHEDAHKYSYDYDGAFAKAAIQAFNQGRGR